MRTRYRVNLCFFQAAFGAETLSKMKDLYVLIVGMRGTGVETAKNLILSNVGGVLTYDPNPTEIRDLGKTAYFSTHTAFKLPCLLADSLLVQSPDWTSCLLVRMQVPTFTSLRITPRRELRGKTLASMN